MKKDHLRINIGEDEDDKKMANSLDHGRKILKQSYRQKKKKRDLDNISHLSFDTVADQSILANLVTDEVRSQQLKSYMRWTLANLLVTLYVLGLVVYLRLNQNDDNCTRNLLLFLTGYSIIMVIHFIKKLCMICCWWKSKEPKEVEIKINILYMFTLFVPEILWYGFGSFFAFREEMSDCR